MAEFEPAFQRQMKNEGGFRLHEIKGDSGGMTYAGIARNKWPNWAGWKIIDRGDMENPMLTQLVREFYIEEFWSKIKGDEIVSEDIAYTLFGMAINSGRRTAIRIAQTVVGTLPDGALGPKTLKAINDYPDTERFVAYFALGRLARYRNICFNKRSQTKFLLGWLDRTLRTL